MCTIISKMYQNSKFDYEIQRANYVHPLAHLSEK